MVRFGTLLIVGLLALPGLAPADRTDLLILDNGNDITGEIRALERGRLTFKTDNVGTLSVEWKHVSELRSTNYFTMETVDGYRYSGSLAEATPGRLKVVRGDVTVATLGVSDVVTIYRVRQTLWSRLDGSLDIGYSYTQQNGSTQFNLDGNVQVRTENRRISVSFSSLFSTQDDAAKTTRNDLTGTFSRRFEGRWSYFGLASVEQNNGLDLDLRTLLGGGIGRELYHSNSAIFALLGGLDYNREFYTFNDDPVDSLEAIVGVEYSYFTFDGLTSQFTTRFFVVPSVTDAGRSRLRLDANLRQNLIGDLYWNLNLYELYDSRPPQPDAPKNDFGVTTSLGWSF